MAFILGLVTSLHCTLMCGPLQAVVMGKWLGGGSLSKVLLYHSGRILTYIAMGLLIGLIGNFIGIQTWQKEFSLIAGLSLLLGYFSIQFLRWDKRINGLITPWLMRIQSKNYQRQSKFKFFVGGSINGLLPCGMVYAALIPAAATGYPGTAGLAMLMFGLGTIPLLVGINLTSNRLFNAHPRLLNKLIPLSVVFVAAILILRGMELGIPFLSPELPIDSPSAEVCD